MTNRGQSRRNLRGKTIEGISWNIVSQVGQQLGSLLTTMILARLLSPHEFGLIAMIAVITSFADIFTDLGFGSALIQKQDIRQVHLSSVFWLNLAIGISLTLILSMASPLIARFYNQPELVPLIIVISTTFTIGSVTIVQRAMVTKALDFRRRAIVRNLGMVVSSAVAIIMALGGAGVWSLAAQSVLLSFISSVTYWRLGEWRPSFEFKWHAIREMLGFSTNVLGSHLLTYWTRNLDYLLIGRFMGTQPLGVYRNAYSIMLLPQANISRVISTVMFSALSQIQEDKAKVRSVFLRVTRTIALLTFPMMTGLFVVAETFVLVIYGSKWAEMIPILQVFCIVGLMQSIGTLNGNLYMSQGKADLQLRVGLINKPVAMLGIILGLPWGALGVAIGYSIASIWNSYPSFAPAGRLVGLTYWQVWRNLAGTLGCSLAMATAVWIVQFMLPATTPYWLRLGVLVSFGVLVYGALIHFFRLQAYVEVREILVGYLPRQLQETRRRRSVLPVAPAEE